MRAAVVVGSALMLTSSACGGSGGSTDARMSVTSEETRVTAPAWAAPLLAKPGPEAAAVMATADFAAGENRVGFLLVRADGSLVESPSADVYYQPQSGGPTLRAAAVRRQVGVRAGVEANDEVKFVYVAKLELPAGKHWIVVQPRGTRFQGFQILDVKERPTAIAVGERAPASRNPTIAQAPARRITTAKPPDVELLRYSVAESLEKGVPFVVAFATPAFCQSRTCGPTVEVVDAVRRKFEDRMIRFIHVEIYEDNIPGNGVNRWVKEWKLPTEPWVFVVDREGIVRDRFEGSVSVGELESSVRRHLTTP